MPFAPSNRARGESNRPDFLWGTDLTSTLLEPIKQAVRDVFGWVDTGVARGFSLRHDLGGQYAADDFQREIAFLGIESSPSFMRAPEGNGCAERIIRTLKGQLLWVCSFFDTVEELRRALEACRQMYNTQGLIERHRSPARSDYLATMQSEAA